MHARLAEKFPEFKYRVLHDHRFSGDVHGFIRKNRIWAGIQKHVCVIVTQIVKEALSVIAFETPRYYLCPVYDIEKAASFYGFFEALEEFFSLHGGNEFKRYLIPEKRGKKMIPFRP